MRVKAAQYTVRNVSRQLDRALKAKAAALGVSLNTLLVQALQSEAGLRGPAKVYDDLNDLFGTWVHDRAVDLALAAQRKVDPKDWA